jgi:hypothetical protein
MQLTRQIGEHLVAAELGRRGYVATPFSGNVPMFDILAADIRGYAIPIQVKTISGASWQFKIDTFLNIEMVENKQVVKGKNILPNPDLVCIFVALKNKERVSNEFYIFRLKDLQDHFASNYKGGVRLISPLSMHCALWPPKLEQFRDNWELLDETFGRDKPPVEEHVPVVLQVS